MAGLSRQFASDSFSQLVTIIWFLIAVFVVYWFYRALRRIEKTLSDIKKLLEGKSQT